MESLTEPPAGIQHDGRPAELSAAGEFIESLGLSRSTMPIALTQPRIRLQATQLNFIAFAFFEADAGMRRTAQHRHQAGQCDCKGRRRPSSINLALPPNEREQS